MIAALMALGLQASAQNRTDNSRRLKSHHVYRSQMSAEQRAEKQSQHMAKKLNLDDRQQRAVYAANLDAARRMDPVKDRMREAKQDARHIHKDRDQALRSTLTVEQYQKLMELRSRRHTARLERGHHGKHKRMMERREFRGSQRS